MSSAFYPLGMNSYNNRLPQGGYATWKGSGVFSNPVGITSGNIRPLTNKDPANNTISSFGLPRPLKHYRRGTTIPIPILAVDPDNPKQLIELIYNTDRSVKSSVKGNMISQMIDTPGQFIVKNNPIDEIDGVTQLQKDCRNCKGIGIVSNWQPNASLTETPEPKTETALLCCNQQKKAIRRVLPASTLLKKNYYTTTFQYLFNRCQTYDQRAFNFYSRVADQVGMEKMIETNPYITAADVALAKPGSALAISNLYVANCNPNIDFAVGPKHAFGCKLVVYKPNNPQFAQQGGVSSSTRTLKLNVTTIDKNIANIRRLRGAGITNSMTQQGDLPITPFIYKTKVENCNPAYYHQSGNPKTCSINNDN